MLTGIARANHFGQQIQPLRLRELCLAFMLGPLCKAASDGMPLLSFGIYRMPMMVAARHYVLRICEVLLFVQTCFSDGSHEVWSLRRPHRPSSVFFHESRQLAQSIVHLIPVTFLPLLLEELKVRLVAVVIEVVLTMHPTLVLCKRFEGEQIGLHHLGDLCHGLVLVHRSSVDVPMEMKIQFCWYSTLPPNATPSPGRPPVGSMLWPKALEQGH